jgi:hypothetical protein
MQTIHRKDAKNAKRQREKRFLTQRRKEAKEEK